MVGQDRHDLLGSLVSANWVNPRRSERDDDFAPVAVQHVSSPDSVTSWATLEVRGTAQPADPGDLVDLFAHLGLELLVPGRQLRRLPLNGP